MDPFTDFRYSAASTSLSEDDNEPGSSNKATKRGSRACDRCRKIKSKCEPTDGDKCKNCLISGTECTFQGPSFKRGPPKGYIHAIEQRWQQVECILATVMSTPRAEGIMADLRQDTFARSVLDRVASGPYGQQARLRQGQGTSQQGFYDAIMGAELGSTYDDRRSRRQSRVSREIVSAQDAASAVPTLEWQNQLARRLARTSGLSSPSPLTSFSSPTTTSPVSFGTSAPGSAGGEPSRRRVRLEGLASLDTAGSTAGHGGPHDMYTLDDTYYDAYRETTHAMGHLSVNENQDIRYHDESAGLHLLARGARNDDSQTKENGIWKFRSPQEGANVAASDPESYGPISWPPHEVQDHLINLYFTYVHPFFPVIHKSTFLTLYEEKKYSPHSRYAKTIQGITDLLLLSMFAFAARYSDDEMRRHPTTTGLHDQVSPGGKAYAEDARKVLNVVYGHSRPSSCQSLLLMGVREFGIGSMEQGWLYVGMGCRMAVDLGMNQNADEWRDSRGEPLFSLVDRHARRQIWASCCIADKLSSIWLGRPVMFREYDYNVEFPAVIEAEEMEIWRPYPPDALGSDYRPEPGRVMSCYRESSKLSLIMSQIMSKIYPVQPSTDTPKRAELERLEALLHHWLFELPDHLRYCETARRLTPPPHVLALHIEYQFAVLLLHRAFIPNWNDSSISNNSPNMGLDPLPLKSFDICQGASAHISSMLTAFHENYSLSRCPPLFNTFLQGAGIMHIVTLMRRPGNTQGTVGLLRCIEAAKAMEGTWPCAVSIRRLLQGAHVQLDDVSAWATSSSRAGSGKRAIEQLSSERNSDVLPRDVFNMIAPAYHPQAGPSHVVPRQQHAHGSHTPSSTSDESTKMPAFTQSMEFPPSIPTQPSPTSTFFPGLEWWPQSMPSASQYEDLEASLRYYPPASTSGQDMAPNFGAPQGPFTFDEGSLSPNFADNVGREPGHHSTHFHPSQNPSSGPAR